MRILLVCPYFPPENTIAALRIAKFAEYWAEAGHEVTVLARAAIRDGVEPPVHARIQVIRVRDPLERAAKVNFAVSTSATRPTDSAARFGVVSWLKSVAKKLIWPDVYGPWGLRARQAGIRSELTPDVVVGSVGPFSALLTARSLARHFKVPLVIDYRDLLTTNAFYAHGRVRRAIDSAVEGSAVKNAALLATVSEPMVEELEATRRKPVVLVQNGFDPDDFLGLDHEPAPSVLRIVYCGTYYPGLFDPSNFLEALRIALDQQPLLPMRLDLYGRHLNEVVKTARGLGLSKIVQYHGEVSHRRSLKEQVNADLLLLLLSFDPRTVGTVSGKLYEYIGARRPIALIGYESSAAARMIRENGLGIVSHDPVELARYLLDLAIEKKESGRVELQNTVNTSLLTREHQSLAFLSQIEQII